MEQQELVLTRSRVEDARSKAGELGIPFAVDRVGHEAGPVICLIERPDLGFSLAVERPGVWDHRHFDQPVSADAVHREIARLLAEQPGSWLVMVRDPDGRTPFEPPPHPEDA